MSQMIDVRFEVPTFFLKKITVYNWGHQSIYNVIGEEKTFSSSQIIILKFNIQHQTKISTLINLPCCKNIAPFTRLGLLRWVLNTVNTPAVYL